jgi:hypothetical protein
MTPLNGLPPQPLKLSDCDRKNIRRWITKLRGSLAPSCTWGDDWNSDDEDTAYFLGLLDTK